MKIEMSKPNAKKEIINPNIRKIYCILADLHDGSPKMPDDVFVGLFRDGSYHILGCRPEGMDYLLPDKRQSQEDWATIKLPEGIKRLEDMKPNTTFESLYHSATNVKSRFYKINKVTPIR